MDIVVTLIKLPLGVFLIYFVSMARDYSVEVANARRIRKTFARYIDPKAANQLLSVNPNELELGGEKKQVAVLFVDIRGFTALSQTLSPEDLVGIVNRYLKLTSECILRYDGMVDKFIGDCTMALFNAPLPQEDYAYKAVLAAMDMIKGTESLNKELRLLYKKELQFGIGIDCGEAVVGNFGSVKKWNYTALGNVVIMAARIESRAPGGCIYLSENMEKELKGRLITVPIKTDIDIKGKMEDLEVYRLEGLAND